MIDFIINGVLWTLAIYGLIEIVKTVMFEVTYTKKNTKGFHFIIAVKNVGDKIEGMLRPILFKAVCDRGELAEDIIITDLGSTDETKVILNNLKKDYGNIKIIEWKDCKDLLEKE